jgi:predicted GNAT superfamily acetyltransferase
VADVTIREAASLDDLTAALGVFEIVWGPDGQPPLNVTRAIHHAGGYAALAEIDGRVVGASLAFLGRTESGAPLLHSHITGTLPDARDRGIGFAIKQHQRTWCLERDIRIITWTFDPLVRRNAYFNLTKLGARATAYHPDFYGAMDDDVNGGDDTDRIIVTWTLDEVAAVDDAVPAEAVVALTIGPDGAPVVGDGTGAVLVHQIPADYHELRLRDPGLGRLWRDAVRKTLGTAIRDGYVGTGVTSDGWYVLRRA